VAQEMVQASAKHPVLGCGPDSQASIDGDDVQSVSIVRLSTNGAAASGWHG